jgi:histone H2B
MSEFEGLPRHEVEMDNDTDEDAYGGFDSVFGGNVEQQEEAPAKRGRGRPKGKPGKSGDAAGAKGVKKHKIKREEDRRYHSYIKKVFKTIHPDMSIHPNTVDVINTCVYDIMTQICEEASRMNSRTNKKTMTASDIKFAVRALFPHEIAKHAETEGVMALARSEGVEA